MLSELPKSIQVLSSKISSLQVLQLVLVCELFNLCYYVYYFFINHYLPAPFVWDKNDTLMDFYNPLFWVVKDGFYTSFQSVYPPLNYFFLKIFSFNIDPIYVLDRFDFRAEYLNRGILISALYISFVLVTVNIGGWKKIKIGNRFMVGLACIISTPVLFALERGNLIFLAILLLAFYCATSNLWLKAIFFGLLVNIKPYFGILLLQYLNFHLFDRSALIKSLLSASLIFIVTGLAVELDFQKFFANYLLFGGGAVISIDGVLSFSNTLMNLYAIKWVIVYGSGSSEPRASYAFWFSLIKALGYMAPAILTIITLAKKLTKIELLIASFLIIANFSISTGGYIYLCYLVLIPYLIRSDEYKKLVIFILVIFIFPFDWIDLASVIYPVKSSFLGGGLSLEGVNFPVSLGSIIRPVANFLMMIVFICNLIEKYGIWTAKIPISRQ